jgi:hypothetical protein
MQTLIRFNGHITWAGQSNGLPPLIQAFVILEDPITEFINQMVEQTVGLFTRNQCMFVQREQGKPIDVRLTPAGRMGVPFHNIAYIEVDVLPITGELTRADEEGMERLSNGEEPVKQ